METRQQKRHVTIALALAALVAAASATASQDMSDRERQAGFRADNQAAMHRMMRAMDVPPSGSVDRDFAAMMIPHHRGAVDMAVAELRFGQDPVLRRMAQEIVVTQRQEIEVMRKQLASPLPGDAASAVPSSEHTHQQRSDK